MAKSHDQFRFKQFSIDHSRSEMKVGTDAVLLGAWADVTDCSDILDIGTGSGVIALMLAQRASDKARIDAVEINENDALLATENVLKSPWPNKVAIHHTAIQHFKTEKQYDLIVSNPPYFSKSYAPPNSRRHEVRHTLALPFQDLVYHVLRLLKPYGKFSVILPVAEAEQLMNLSSNQLFCVRARGFRARIEKPPERRLLEFEIQPGCLRLEPDLILYNQHDEWTADYRKLTSEFYLKA